MDSFLSTKVTKCNHFFHAKCLRKWLYVQDSCPLCYGSLYEDKVKKETENNNAVNQAQDIAENNEQEGLIDHDHAMERPIDDSDENNTSDSSDDNNDSDSSSDGNSEEINELAEDTDVSESDDEESQDNDEGSWSCSDEDDLHYDSMDDCKKNIHSENTYSSSNVGTERKSDNIEHTSCKEDSLSSSSSKIVIKSSHLSNSIEENDKAIEVEEIRHNHTSISSSKCIEDHENKIDIDKKS